MDGRVLEALRIPPVVAFTGHMLDAPGRKSPRFVESAVEAVRCRIAELLDRLQALPGFGEEKSKIFLALLAKHGVTP